MWSECGSMQKWRLIDTLGKFVAICDKGDTFRDPLLAFLQTSPLLKNKKNLLLKERIYPWLKAVKSRRIFDRLLILFIFSGFLAYTLNMKNTSPLKLLWDINDAAVFIIARISMNRLSRLSQTVSLFLVLFCFVYFPIVFFVFAKDLAFN